MTNCFVYGAAAGVGAGAGADEGAGAGADEEGGAGAWLVVVDVVEEHAPTRSTEINNTARRQLNNTFFIYNPPSFNKLWEIINTIFTSIGYFFLAAPPYSYFF